MRYTILLLLTLCSATFAQQIPVSSTGAIQKSDSLEKTNNNPQLTDFRTLFPQITPQSPNVASLGRFGDHPVSFYTGLPTINVPIYNVTAGTVQVPVTLAYHAGGNRVTDRASWVGLGWAVQAGSMITRNAIGVPDELTGGVLTNTLNTTLSVPATLTTGQCTSALDLMRNYVKAPNDVGVKDNAYDVFNYSLPSGKSGRFILLPDPITGNAVTLMPAEPVRVNYTISNPNTAPSISSFTITDETGIKYCFEQGEGSSGGNQLLFTSAWHLTQIQGLAPQEVIRFTYTALGSYGQTETTDTYTVVDKIGVNMGTGSCPDPTTNAGSARDLDRDISSVITPQLLTEIQFPGGKLTFTPTGTNRADLTIPALDYIQLLAITTASAYTLIKTFDLQQTYFGANDRLRLDAVVFQDDSGNPIGRYTFGYNTATALPVYGSRSRDAWGYFNNKPNIDLNNPARTTLVPSQTVIVENSTTTTLVIGGADRSTDETAMQAWILNSITYPTSGTSTFFYEANRYLDGTVKLAGGLRVSRIETKASSSTLVQIKTYRYGDGLGNTGYGRLTENPSQNNRLGWWNYTNFVISPNCTGYRTQMFGGNFNSGLAAFESSPVVYPQVTEFDGTTAVNNGYTVYTFTDNETSDSRCELRGININKFFTESRVWARGQLKSKVVYGSVGKVMDQTTTFTVLERPNPPGMVVLADRLSTISASGFLSMPSFLGAPGICSGTTGDCALLCSEFPKQGSNAMPQVCVWRTGIIRPVQTITRTYPSDGTTIPTSTTTQTDYDPVSFQMRETRQYVEGNVFNGNAVIGSRLTYPQDFTLTIPANANSELLGILRLKERNAYLPIETVQFRQKYVADPRQYTTGKLTTYKSVTATSVSASQGWPLPARVLLVENNPLESWTYTPSATRYNSGTTGIANFPTDAKFKERVVMTTYDTYGNLTRLDVTNGPATTYAYSTLTPATGRIFSVVTGQTANAGLGTAQTTTYTYAVPMLGPSRVTDPRGVQINYVYDRFGRLGGIYDHFNQLLKQFTYAYPTGIQP